MSNGNAIDTWEGKKLFPDDGRCYFGGRVFDNWLEIAGGPISAQRTSGVVIIPTEAGTHILQRYYRGPTVSAAANARAFSTGFLADSQSDYFAWTRIQGRGEATTFFPGLWESELFNVTSGQTYKLRRLPALGVVPGLEAEDFPVEVYLDGEAEPDPAAATISGRNVTALVSGQIEVLYAPLYTVVITAQGEQVEDSNTMLVTMTLTEVVLSEV